MSLERQGLTFPNKPEFISPFFSYRVVNPSKIVEIVSLLNKTNESFSVQVGQDTHSIVGPPEINSWGPNKFLEFHLPLRLPSNDYLHDFINNPGLLSASGRRAITLLRQFRRHIDKDLDLYDDEVRKVKGSTIVRKVAELPNRDSSSYKNYLPLDAFRNRSHANDLMVKHYLDDGLKMLTIFCTMLYQHHGINDMQRELVIDPSVFKLIYERRRPMSLEEIKELEKHAPEIIARAVLGVDKPAEEVSPSESDDKTRLEKDVEERRN